MNILLKELISWCYNDTSPWKIPYETVIIVAVAVVHLKRDVFVLFVATPVLQT